METGMESITHRLRNSSNGRRELNPFWRAITVSRTPKAFICCWTTSEWKDLGLYSRSARMQRTKCTPRFAFWLSILSRVRQVKRKLAARVRRLFTWEMHPALRVFKA